MALETMPLSRGMSSSSPMRSSRLGTQSGEKRRITSSLKETKKRELPGSPWRPERPRSWLSMRRGPGGPRAEGGRPPGGHDLMGVPLPALFGLTPDLLRLLRLQRDEVFAAPAG